MVYKLSDTSNAIPAMRRFEENGYTKRNEIGTETQKN
jgi:hypothetical protein